MDTFTVTLMHGVHQDPRLADLPVFYGLGSYIPHPIPETFTYVYLVLRNDGAAPLQLRDIWLETLEGRQLRHLDLPADALHGQILHPGRRIAFGFLRHLLTRALRGGARLTGEQTFLACAAALPTAPTSPSDTALPAVTAKSEELRLSLEYPTQPLEDVELLPYADFFLHRGHRFREEAERIRGQHGSLRDYANLHLSWGLRKSVDASGNACWLLREYLPAATKVWLTTDKLKFQRWAHHSFQPVLDHASRGWWTLRLPAAALEHGTYMELRIISDKTPQAVRRIPAMATWVEQDKENPGQWCARVWDPQHPYSWRYRQPAWPLAFPRIYEAHIGMSQPARADRHPETVGSFAQFERDMLPRIRETGYTAVQLMGVLEHPLYKSFGYQVSNYFAVSSRFGTPDDFKAMVDAAHGLGLAVILDIPHSHSSPNTEQGIARYDTSPFFFAEKDNQWGTLSFDYSKEMTRRFLLSNCRHWMEEYRVDGFRFDAVGNMIYKDHGFGDGFTHVGRCFYTMDGEPRADEDGILYLGLANALVHELRPESITIAEEFSGMPGLTVAPEQGGLGFDYRFAMGVPDFWGKFLKEGREMGALWHELTNHRPYDRTISYVECHDQSINGKDAMIWRIMGDAMYTGMGRDQQSWPVTRGMALYKLMRLVTLATAHAGYLNFMGAEFGHPEWLDEGAYGHRQWHLAGDQNLKYSQLAAFDHACLHSIVARHLQQFEHEPQLRLLHESDRLLAFERGGLLFACNFHETRAQSALPIMVTPGKYVELDSTDDLRYGGCGNLLATGLEHFSDPTSGIDEQRVCLYLPPLTALVLIRNGGA